MQLENTSSHVLELKSGTPPQVQNPWLVKSMTTKSPDTESGPVLRNKLGHVNKTVSVKSPNCNMIMTLAEIPLSSMTEVNKHQIGTFTHQMHQVI